MDSYDKYRLYQRHQELLRIKSAIDLLTSFNAYGEPSKEYSVAYIRARRPYLREVWAGRKKYERSVGIGQ
jgi:hypothetical protein